MNIYLDSLDAPKVKPSQLSDWLLEHGIPAVTTEEASRILGVDRSQVRVNLAQSRKRGSIISPARGLWVPVPLENRLAGHPDPMSYINTMMRKLDRKYCVGWLTAAALHGVSHQAPQVFQVATFPHLADRSVGDSRLNFLTRSRIEDIPATVIFRSQGGARVATPAATMLMLGDDIAAAGGLDNAATTIVELAEEYPDEIEQVCNCADAFPLAAKRRVGWILDTFGEGMDTDTIAADCASREGSVSRLSPMGGNTGSVSKRWNLLINREVDPDL